MVGHGSKFGRKKEAAIAALLKHRTVSEAAREVEIGIQTLYRWMKDPEFDADLRKAKQAAFGQANARLQQAAQPAAALMYKTIMDTTVPLSIRLRAADRILSYAQKARDSEQTEERLAALEQKVKESCR